MRYTPIILLFLAGNAFANGDTWIKRDNPDELYVTTYAYDCPFNDETLSRETRGVVIRSRIRPVDRWNEGEILLYVQIQCLRDNSLYLFDIDIHLAKFALNADDDIVVSHTFSTYGSLGQGGRDYILDSVKDGVEAALTDYLVANFDLGDHN